MQLSLFFRVLTFNFPILYPNYTLLLPQSLLQGDHLRLNLVHAPPELVIRLRQEGNLILGDPDGVVPERYQELLVVGAGGEGDIRRRDLRFSKGG